MIQDPRRRAFMPISRAPLSDAPDRSGSWRPSDDDLRAWGRRLLPAEVERDVFSRCALFEQSRGHAVVTGLDRASYESAVRLWSPVRHRPVIVVKTRAEEIAGR